MRLVKLILLLTSFIMADQTKIICSYGTRDYDNETLFEAAYGDLNGLGRVLGSGCAESVSVAAEIFLSGITNTSATNYMEFTPQSGALRILYSSQTIFRVEINYTKIKNYRLYVNASGKVGIFTNSGADNNLFDGIYVGIGHASAYGVGFQSGVNNNIQNTVIYSSAATRAVESIYLFNAGTNVKIYNVTVNSLPGTGTAIGALSGSCAATVTNCAIRASVCLNTGNAPTYVKTKVYTSDATGTNTNITDPQFNFDTDGYTLKTGSVLINSGNDIAGFTNSINGVTRPSGYWDVGAYELSSGNPATGTRCGILYRMGLAPRSR